MIKKILLVALALTLSLCLIAGCSNTGQDAADGGGSGDPTEISMLILSHASWPYDESWWIWDKIEEKTNVKLNVTALDISSFGEKFQLMVASGELPDIVSVDNPAAANKYGLVGAYVNIKDYLDKMPNLSKFIEKYPEYYELCIAHDGNVYALPVEGMGETNRRGWLYRKDILDKHNLAAPTTMEELYQVLKALKGLYPDSYPLSFRSWANQLPLIAHQWGTRGDIYFDEENKEVKYGPIENEYRDMIEFLSKLYKERLIPQDFLSIDTKQWQDLMSSDTAFVTIDYLSRVDFFNVALRPDNPDYTIAYLAPPKGGENGEQKLAFTAEMLQSYAINAKSPNVDKIMEFIDYYYSEDAYETLSWGEEGVTYTVEDGEKKFIDVTETMEVRKKYGLSTYGTYLWFDYSSHESTFSDEAVAAYEEARKYENPQIILPAISEEAQDRLTLLKLNVDKAKEEALAKFIIGERSISEWDKYVEELKGWGLDEMLDIYAQVKYK